MTETKLYGVRIIIGGDVGYPREGWAKGSKNLTYEAAVALADQWGRMYPAWVKEMSATEHK